MSRAVPLIPGELHIYFCSSLNYVFYCIIYLYEPAQEKTYNKICVTSKDSDQPVHPPSMTILIYPSLGGPDTIEGTCDQRRFWSDCADAQADLSLRWSHKSYCRFCRVLAHIKKKTKIKTKKQMDRNVLKCTSEHVRTLTSQIILRIRRDWSQFSLSAWRNRVPLVIKNITEMTQIELLACAGWSEYSPGVHVRRYFFLILRLRNDIF